MVAVASGYGLVMVMQAYVGCAGSAVSGRPSLPAPALAAAQERTRITRIWHAQDRVQNAKVGEAARQRADHLKVVLSR